MQTEQSPHKFEPFILNQIYNTDVFPAELSHINYDYSPFLSAFISFQTSNNVNENIEKNKLIQEILEIASFVSNPANFSCYEQLYKLKSLLEKHENFSFILNQDEKKYCFIDVIVFSALHNCKLWSKLYRPGHGKKMRTQENGKKEEKNQENEDNPDNMMENEKNEEENKGNITEENKHKDEKIQEQGEKHQTSQKLTPLYNLFKWFFIFEKTFTDLIKYRFNPSLLDPKNKKRQERLSKLKKRNPEFINAVKEKDYQKVEELLKQGVDIKVVDSEDGSSAGHISCKLGDLRLCKLLDEYGINWEAENLENITPVFNAIESANIELISYLFDVKKVNIEHNDFQNRYIKS